jgi:hypothetical protein
MEFYIEKGGESRLRSPITTRKRKRSVGYYKKLSTKGSFGCFISQVHLHVHLDCGHFFKRKIYINPPKYYSFFGWPPKLPMLKLWPPNYHFLIFWPHPSIYAVNSKQNSENTPPTL